MSESLHRERQHASNLKLNKNNRMNPFLIKSATSVSRCTSCPFGAESAPLRIAMETGSSSHQTAMLSVHRGHFLFSTVYNSQRQEAHRPAAWVRVRASLGAQPWLSCLYGSAGIIGGLNSCSLFVILRCILPACLLEATLSERNPSPWGTTKKKKNRKEELRNVSGVISWGLHLGVARNYSDCCK